MSAPLHEVIPTPKTGTPWVPTASPDTVTPIDATHYMVGPITPVTWHDRPHCSCVTFSFNQRCPHVKLVAAYRAAQARGEAA